MTGGATPAADVRAAAFGEARDLLFSIAYRMVGSVADAEDLVQDAYLRWQQASATDVRMPRAYLTTIITRLALNHLQSARVQRESYVGSWLPEPLMTEHAPDPSEPVELAESLSMAFMVLLERLSPVERAVLLLHDVFDFGYADIARIVERSEVNCRQLLSRARKHIASPHPRFDANPAEAQRLLELFNRAALAGDMEGMLAVLADDITLYADGGGKAAGAARRPIHGSDSVARFVIGTVRRVAPTCAMREVRINGQPGMLIYVSGRRRAALAFDIQHGRIQSIYAVGNPDKLRRLPELG